MILFNYKDAFNNPNAFALTAENIDKNTENENFERYELLAEDVKFQIKFIDDYYVLNNFIHFNIKSYILV